MSAAGLRALMLALPEGELAESNQKEYLAKQRRLAAAFKYRPLSKQCATATETISGWGSYDATVRVRELQTASRGEELQDDRRLAAAIALLHLKDVPLTRATDIQKEFCAVFRVEWRPGTNALLCIHALEAAARLAAALAPNEEIDAALAYLLDPLAASPALAAFSHAAHLRAYLRLQSLRGDAAAIAPLPPSADAPRAAAVLAGGVARVELPAARRQVGEEFAAAVATPSGKPLYATGVGLLSALAYSLRASSKAAAARLVPTFTALLAAAPHLTGAPLYIFSAAPLPPIPPPPPAPLPALAAGAQRFGFAMSAAWYAYMVDTDRALTLLPEGGLGLATAVTELSPPVAAAAAILPEKVTAAAAGERKGVVEVSVVAALKVLRHVRESLPNLVLAPQDRQSRERLAPRLTISGWVVGLENQITNAIPRPWRAEEEGPSRDPRGAAADGGAAEEARREAEASYALMTLKTLGFLSVDSRLCGFYACASVQHAYCESIVDSLRSYRDNPSALCLLVDPLHAALTRAECVGLRACRLSADARAAPELGMVAGDLLEWFTVELTAPPLCLAYCHQLAAAAATPALFAPVAGAVPPPAPAAGPGGAFAGTAGVDVDADAVGLGVIPVGAYVTRALQAVSDAHEDVLYTTRASARRAAAAAHSDPAKPPPPDPPAGTRAPLTFPVRQMVEVCSFVQLAGAAALRTVHAGVALCAGEVVADAGAGDAA